MRFFSPYLKKLVKWLLYWEHTVGAFTEFVMLCKLIQEGSRSVGMNCTYMLCSQNTAVVVRSIAPSRSCILKDTMEEEIFVHMDSMGEVRRSWIFQWWRKGRKPWQFLMVALCMGYSIPCRRQQERLLGCQSPQFSGFKVRCLKPVLAVGEWVCWIAGKLLGLELKYSP